MRWIVVAVLVAACGDNRRDTPFTPEEITATAADGATVTFEGLVHTISFDNTPTSDGGFELLPDRFLLVRSTVPPKIRVRDQDFDSGATLAAWGLGVRLPAASLDDALLPPIGARVKVTGTFRRVAWAGITVPMIEDATAIEILEGGLTLGMTGASCDNDLDCHDRLICDRATLACVAPPLIEWSSELRGVNGACVTDADCPMQQRCDDRYTLLNDGNTYAPPYFAARDAGKHLCVPVDGATVASLCPHIYTTADLSGGRFVTGKEVCVRAETWLAVHAEDGDTHLQTTTEEPLPYPLADTPYWIFGSTTENAPPYKDPSRPQGAVIDPEVGDVMITVGPLHYDPDHGWFEIHPVKAYFPISAGKGDADMKRRYRTWPEGFDAEAWEQVEGGPYKRNLRPSQNDPR